MSINTYTIVSFHFGDLFWIAQLADRVGKYSSEAVVQELVPVNQDRSSETHARLINLPRVKRVFEFPVDTWQTATLGHDHPSALNHAVSCKFKTSHLIILDSDCFPLSNDWVLRIGSLLSSHQAIVAADPAKWGLSHPCFMVFPVTILDSVDFSEGLNEVGMDTGRLVGLQLSKTGIDTYFDRPKPAFRGHRGHLYLDGSLYHHENASFISSAQSILRRQVQEGRELFFRRKVASDDFKLTVTDIVLLKLIGLWLFATLRFQRMTGRE